MNAPGVLAFTLVPGSVHLRWAERNHVIASCATEIEDGWIFGPSACDDPQSVDVTELVDDPDTGEAPDVDDLLSGLVVYAAATAGTPPTVGTVLAVHPTWWNERRRGLIHTAARQIGDNAVLVSTASAAYRAASPSGHERCVVLEFTTTGVVASSVRAEDGDTPVVGRTAREPVFDPAESSAAKRLESLIGAVLGPHEPDLVLVAGPPGEPSGMAAFDRVRDLIGSHRRVVPIAGAETTAAAPDVCGALLPSTLGSPAVVRPAAEAGTASPDPPDERVLPWLQGARVAPAPGRSVASPTVTVVVAVAAALVIGLVLWVTVSGRAAAPERSAQAPLGAAVADRSDFPATPAEASTSTGQGPVQSVEIAVGPVRIELPEHWRIRDVEGPAGRIELVPAHGADRRIVIVHSALADGTDRTVVAEILRERAAERGGVIRDLDTDTRFADRAVVAYTEVPDDFSEVRWSVLVFPGLQVSVGCQYLRGEWVQVRSECEQAVHTLEAG